MRGVNRIIVMGTVKGEAGRDSLDRFVIPLAIPEGKEKFSREKSDSFVVPCLVHFAPLQALCEKRLKEGDQVFITGALGTGRLDDDLDNPAPVIVVHDIEFVGGREASQKPRSTTYQAPSPGGYPSSDPDQENIPF